MNVYSNLFASFMADGEPETVVEFEVEVKVHKDDVDVKVLNGAGINSESEDGE